MKIDNLIEETIKARYKLFNNNPTIGWWTDNDPVTLYYGSTLKEVKGILKEGIYADDTGYVLCAIEPYTAIAQNKIQKQLNEGRFIVEETAVIFSLKIPKKFLHKTPLLIEGDRNQKVLDKELYENWGKSDVEYYSLIDIRIPEYIPVEFIKEYMVKNG